MLERKGARTEDKMFQRRLKAIPDCLRLLWGFSQHFFMLH